MDYRVAIATSYDHEGECASKLEREVNKLLKEGWKLQGGVSISRSEYFHFEHFCSITMTQAMTKE